MVKLLLFSVFVKMRTPFFATRLSSPICSSLRKSLLPYKTTAS